MQGVKLMSIPNNKTNSMRSHQELVAAISVCTAALIVLVCAWGAGQVMGSGTETVAITDAGTGAGCGANFCDSVCD